MDPSANACPLPDTFTYTDARRAGLSKRHIYQLRDQGMIEQIGHGLFHRTDAGWDADIDLIEIATRAPQATLCLSTLLTIASHFPATESALRTTLETILA